MLVKLTSSTSGEMVMLSKHAHPIFEWIGKAGTTRGVFTAEQLPEAIAGLRRAVEEEKLAAKREAEEAQSDRNPARDDETREKRDDDTEETVTLGQRAMPLIRLMEWTLKEKGFITWEAPGDF